jgi:hypothetical protein
MHTLKHGIFALVLLALAACSGGAATSVNPVTSAQAVPDYTGPAPSTADVQAFKINLWENIKASNRCGGCHNATGQSPQFARNDDVNLAYAAANSVVNLLQPDQSMMVVKVAGGHNCWLSSPQACGDILTTWIRNWAGSVSTGGQQIQLVAPVDQTVGASKTFPADSTLFANTIYPIVHSTNRGNCVRCHSSSAATPQSPYFASNDVNEAYAAAMPKIDLNTPSNSRFVVRLRDEFHNCWTMSCANDAATMLAAVQAFANGIPLTQVNPSLVISKALHMYDGTVASGANRYDTSQIALYEFKTGSGTTVFDTSGVDPALNLNLSGNVTWVGGWGINIGAGGKAQGTTTASKKLADMIMATGEYSIELWAAPANVVQTNAYLLSYSASNTSRNVTLAQNGFQYAGLGRSSTTDANGAPSLLTKASNQNAQASLQHIVLTFDPVNGRRLYVNGNYTGDVDPAGGGSLSDWDDTFALILGNETSNNRQWTGVIKMAAVHSRALTAAQVQQNFAAGVGESYYLLFNVSTLTGVAQSYIMFQVSQYDSYSYLFNKPTFISLDPTATPNSIPIKGMRIGINGAEAISGQAYANVNTTLNSAAYSPTTGQLLSQVGTVIALQGGPATDLFFLTFDQIGTNTYARTVAVPVSQVPVDLPAEPDIGVRTFDQLNHSMAKITGIPVTQAAVMSTFQTLQQQLPPVPDIQAFLAANQTAIAQLAIQYCGAMVDNATTRTAFFGTALDVTASPSTLFATQAGMNIVIQPLLNQVVGAGLASQPAAADVTTTLTALMTKLMGDGASTPTIAKAACAAALGSGILTVQ